MASDIFSNRSFLLSLVSFSSREIHARRRGFMRLVSSRVIRPFHRRLALIASSRRRPGLAFFRETRERMYIRGEGLWIVVPIDDDREWLEAWE